MILEFTTTATCRPEILRRTYESFAANLRGVEMKRSRLFINIDPIPEMDRVDEVIDVAREFFGDVVAQMPVTPSFPRAVKWCWSQPHHKFFFHLEDDWIMKAPYEIDEMIRLIEGRSCVNLRAYLFDEHDDRICLSPCLLRQPDAFHMASRMSPHANPEKQLRPVDSNNPHGGKHGNFTGIQTPASPIIWDIGREWLATSGWEKTIPVHFTTWIQLA